VGSKLYWYGSGGEILAETNAAGASINDYVYFGGKRVALVPATGTALYYAEDSLGSSRVMVQSTGTVCYDADFTPFGAERAITNTCTQNAYKFEGKERDAETQNDDFGAREYSWRMGRWLSSDWSAVPVAVPYANLTNPQTLNLYSMVGDDPESFADLDGHGEGQVMLDRFEEQCRQGGDCSPVKPLLLVAGAATAGIGAEMAGGSVLLRNLLGLALATSPRTVPIIADVIEGLTPGPAGSLTISSATRLTQQEISTGVRLATQTGKGLAESAHVGEEFVDAAGKTYDAMGGGKAFEHFGDGSKFFDSIVSHTNKSVDVVALDLKGASKGQVGAINDFVKTLTKAQQQKIRRIY
jgi:RHS repeat-associated protein